MTVTPDPDHDQTHPDDDDDVDELAFGDADPLDAVDADPA
jgi:hypothetical protein